VGPFNHADLNVRLKVEDGSLSHTASKRRLNITTRLGVRDGAGSPTGNILRIRYPPFCSRPCAHRQSCLRSTFSCIFAVKAGYPPRSLTAVIPELPLSSLGLAPGDQLIVNQKSGSAAPPTGVTSTAQSLPTNPRALVNPAASLSTPSSNAAQAAPALSTTRSGSPDHVEVDGGYLVHRVRVIDWSLARCILLRVLCLADRARRQFVHVFFCCVRL
jgi:hypothetical protein